MLEKNEKRLIVNINHLRSFNAEEAHRLVSKSDLHLSVSHWESVRFLRNPVKYLPACEDALKDFVGHVRSASVSME